MIDSFEELLKSTYQDFGPLYDALEADTTAHTPDTILEDDTVHSRGSQAYANSGGRLAQEAS